MIKDTYGIHESSSTLREGGPAVAEMLLDRIKELEERLREYVSFTEEMIDSGESGSREVLIQKRAISALNKEQK